MSHSSASVHRHPDELLSHIFQAAYDIIDPDNPSGSTQSACSRVCRRWSQVALSCTSLRSAFEIKAPEHVQIIERRMRRWGDWAPLSIKLNDTWTHNAELRGLAQAFIGHNKSRLTAALSIEGGCLACSGHVFSTINQPTDAYVSKLRYLSIQEDYVPFMHEESSAEPLDLRNFRGLQSLSFSANQTSICHGYRTPAPILFPTSGSLADLTLHSMELTSTQLRRILRDCPHLERLSLSDMSVGPSDADSDASCPKLTLPNLNRLRLYIDMAAPDGVVLAISGIELPSLQMVDLWGSVAFVEAVVMLLRSVRAARHVRISLFAMLLETALGPLWKDNPLIP